MGTYCLTWRLQTKTFNLPETKVIRDLNPSDINKLISVSGMVTRASTVIPDLQCAQTPPCNTHCSLSAFVCHPRTKVLPLRMCTVLLLSPSLRGVGTTASKAISWLLLPSGGMGSQGTAVFRPIDGITFKIN